MGFGIGGADRFKSYSSNSDAGGNMGVFARKRKKKNQDEENKKDDENLFESDEEQDDDDLEIDMDDADFLD